MDYREFSAKIKAKHPVYADMDDRELAEKIVKKFPSQYSDVTFDAPATPREPTPILDAARDLVGIDKTASTGTQWAQAGSTMFRGTRGLAVAASQAAPTLMNPVRAVMNPQEAIGNLGAAVQRGAEATRPGFKPEGFTESVVSGIGESGPLLPLAGPIAAAGGVGGGVAAAGIGAGQSALMQKSERGSINPMEVGFTAALNGLLPVLPALIKKAYPTIASRLTDTPKEAFKKLQADPDFLKKYSGSVEAINTRSKNVVTWFKALEHNVKSKLDAVEEIYQIRPTAQEQIAENLKMAGAPRTIDVIEKEFGEIVKRSKPFLSEKVKLPVLNAEGKEIFKTVKTPGLSKRDQLYHLSKLYDDLNEQLRIIGDGTTGNKSIFGLKTRLKQQIKTLPGGEELFDAKESFFKFRKVAENLTNAMTDEKTSPAVLEKLVRGDIRGALTIKQEGLKSTIDEMERYGMPMTMKPLRNEILSGMLREATSKNTIPKNLLSQFLFAFNPALGAAHLAGSSPRLSAAMIQLGRTIPMAESSVVAPSLLRGDK